MFNLKKSDIKIIVDALLTVSLLMLMSYELLGSQQHEIVGIIMFALFILHHILNANWTKNIAKGILTPIRFFQNTLVILVLISLIGSTVSGVIISRHLFKFLSLPHPAIISRIHMLSAYWGFIFMSMHLGLHFNIFSLRIKRNFSKPIKTAVKFLIAIVFAYGIFAFFKRDIAGYLFLKNQFFILGDNELLPLYILDYMSVMFSVALISHSISSALRKFRNPKA